MRFDQRFRRVIRFFPAAPGDLGAERKAVEGAVREFSRPGGPAARRGFHVEIVDGFQSPVPDAGRPQQVILDQVPPSSWDVFVGMLWGRFGMPPGASNPRTGAPLESGTEEEFEHAYQAWKASGGKRPRILLYRCDRPLPPSETDVEQLLRVHRFFQRCAPGGEHPAYYQTFKDTAELQRLVVRALEELLDELEEEEARPEPAEAAGPAVEVPAALIRVNIEGRGRMIEQFGEAGRAILDDFQRFIDRAASGRRGLALDWDGDESVICFTGPDRNARAVLTAFEIHQMLPLLRLDRTLNPLGIPLVARIAGHTGLIEDPASGGSVLSEAFDRVADLEERGTKPDEICLTDELYQTLDPALQRLFQPKGRFHGQPVYVHPPPRRECPPERALLDGFLDETRAQAESLVACLDGGAVHLSRGEIETIRSGIADLYDAVRRFQNWFPQIDDRWAADYLREINGWILVLLELDGALDAAFRRRLREFPDQAGQPLDLLDLQKLFGYLRSWPVTRLERLREELRDRAMGVPEPATARVEGAEPSRETRAKAERLAMTRDGIEAEEAFADLTGNRREEMLLLAEEEPANPAFLDRIWERADALLARDLHADPRQGWRGRASLFGALAANPSDPGRFHTVRAFLGEAAVPTAEGAARRFEGRGLAAGETSDAVQVLWKSLLVAHPSAEVRRRAAELVDPRTAWLLLTCPEVPLRVILEMALRFHREGDADLQKLFFDCTRPRIARALEGDAGDEFDRAQSLLVLLYSLLPFSEEHYWSRLEPLYETFVERAFRIGRRSGLVEGRRAWLAERRPLTGRVLAWRRSPALVKELPEPVLRHVAREGCYLDHCVTQRDAIALEAFPHLRPQNLAKVLTPRFNPRLLHKLCDEAAWCGQAPLAGKILRHPNCPAPFARRHLRTLGANELSLLGRDSGANPEVRAMARQLAKPAR
jgi:hypothetical protein